MKKYQIGILVIGLALTACSERGKTSNASSGADNCTLEYDASSTNLTWTAYKTSDKIGVPGSFDNFEVKGTKSGQTAIEVIENATFQITTSSVNSNNPDRDGKISRSFFGSMMSGMEISGRLVSIDSNSAVLGIGMNDQFKEVPAEVVLEGNTITLSADIDVNDFEASSSLDSLNVVCEDLHKAEDGKSILWPNVKIEVSTTLKSNCP